MANEDVGVLDLPGDLAASRQASSTTAGIEGNCMGGQTGAARVPDIIAR